MTRSGDTSGETTINYETADVSATADVDYLATSGVLTFIPGETTKTISVTVLGDSTAEYHEDFKVQLTDEYDNVIVGTGTIINDDKRDPAASASAIDAALAAWAELDSSDDNDSDILTQTLADDLALMMVG